MLTKSWAGALVLSGLFISGCAGQYACRDQLLAPEGYNSKILMVGCGAGGDTRPGMTSERGFVLQKDPNGNEFVTALDTGFASEGSTKNAALGIVNTAVHGGLQAVTAGQFKPNKYNSNITVSGSQETNQAQHQGQEQTQGQNQDQTATGGQGGEGGKGGEGGQGYGGHATASPTVSSSSDSRSRSGAGANANADSSSNSSASNNNQPNSYNRRNSDDYNYNYNRPKTHRGGW